MENSGLKRRVVAEVESLISTSCSKKDISRKSQDLHEIIIKKHYNAADVTIDYHRNRVIMEVVMDDSFYDPKKMNFSIPLLRTNIFFNNLKEFLTSCLDRDNASIAFYASLLKVHANSDPELVLMP